MIYGFRVWLTELKSYNEMTNYQWRGPNSDDGARIQFSELGFKFSNKFTGTPIFDRQQITYWERHAFDNL